MPARKVDPVTGSPALFVMTCTPWWLWKMARISANTNMPRISKITPVLLTMATSRTP